MSAVDTPIASELPVAAPKQVGSLFGPVVDFICLGGGSLILIAILAIVGIDASQDFYATIFSMSLVVAHAINNPHFAHSYQLFYKNFSVKAFGKNEDSLLKARYVTAGIAIPLFLIGFMGLTIASGDAETLGLAANLMGFLVGWHYVKQGYGILIVMSVLKKSFFSQKEKYTLLANAYACWISFWLGMNWVASERNLWGIKHYMVHVPFALLVLSLALSTATTIALIIMLFRKWRQERKLATNGLVAYLTTLYVWLALLIDPIFALIVPACHSLQYLTVVWRYRLNFEADIQQKVLTQSGAKPYSQSASFRFAVFVFLGTLLGYVGFWFAPQAFDSVVQYDTALFGSTLFLFVFWVFINVHHYALDNVMWRKGNKDTAKYVFGHVR